MARHDPQRTGAATGTSNITNPVAYWRYYLGGSIGSNNARFVKIDGLPAALVVAAGRVTAKRFSNDMIWQTPPINVRTIVGIDDLDGDGSNELVVRSPDHVYIIAIDNGAIRWTEPTGEMGTIGSVRMADLNGDDNSELVIAECWCCAIQSGKPGFVYSFANGYDNATELWQLPWGSCGAGQRVALVNVRGAQTDVLWANSQSMSLLDGATGAILATSPSILAAPWTSCRGTNIDGQPGDEIFCVTDSKFAAVERKAFVMSYDADAATLQRVWTRLLPPFDGGSVSYTEPMTDLDGNGSLEIILSNRDASGLWTTRIFAASDGTELGSIVGELVVGPAAIASTSGALLLTMSDARLSAWVYDPNGSTPLSLAWSLNDQAPFVASDPRISTTTPIASSVITTDVDGDGIDELITKKLSDGAQLVAYKATDGSASVAASYPFVINVDQLAFWILPDGLSTKAHFAVARNDGVVAFFDQNLRPTSFGDDVTSAGLMVGGYYADGRWRDLRRTPAVGRLSPDTGSEGIVVSNSQHTLLRLEASLGTFAAPPRTLWRKTNSFGQSIVAGIAGNLPGIACMAVKEPITSPPTHVATVLRADGTTFWEVSLPSSAIHDLVPGHFDTDGHIDLVFQWGALGDTLLRTRALSGDDGGTLWDSVPVEAGAGRQPAGLSVGRWDSDDYDDVYYQAEATRVLSGADGSSIGTSPPGMAYFMATIFDVDGDGSSEVTLHGGLGAARTLTHDLSNTVWQGTQADRPYPYGAIARCPDDTNRLVEGSWEFPARLKTTIIGGTRAGESHSLVLAGGMSFSDESSANAAGVWQGQLTSATVHSNLTGAGRPSALVGSTDGFLYAVDPCSNTVDFAKDLKAPVGEAVYGDTDGDGLDEIIVTAADGYLYKFKQFVIDKPGFVWDIDVAANITDHDVNRANNTTALSAKWGMVAGAAAYEIAVVDVNRNYVTTPAWQNIGNQTSFTLAVPLTDNQVYFFAVRAVADDGRVSVDSVSNGLLIAPLQDADTDAGVSPRNPSGGCCRTSHNGLASNLMLLALVVLVALRRRSDQLTVKH